MPAKKSTKKSATKSSSKTAKKHILFREIPTLHSLVSILYVLLAILFVAIYLTRFA